MNAPVEPSALRLGTVPVVSARDGFVLRRVGKTVAELLGSDDQDAVRLATALSELCRDLLGSELLTARFDLHLAPLPGLHVTLEWQGARVPSDETVGACGRLLTTRIGPGGAGGWVSLEQQLPHLAGDQLVAVQRARWLLDSHGGESDLDDSRAQAHDLIAALEQTRAQREELKRLNEELAETNRGVVALYAELSKELEETNRGVVALYAELDEKSRQLREASEAKTRFWANVSHELRTPVNAVVGLAELLLADTGCPEAERGQQLSLIADSGRTLLALVDELLDVAKAESGNLEPTWAQLDLRAVLTQLEGTLRGLAGPDVELAITAPQDPRPVLGDETMLTRILRNLLSNALKFTETGSVNLDARFDGTGPLGPEQLVLTVADTGIGIPVDQQSRVFEEFYQVRGPHQRGRHGTGLGLPYARRLAELLGGELHLSSTEGVGTTITVRLPLSPDQGGGPAPRAARVVVVDDDPAFRAVLKPLLHEVAEHVVEVADSAEALSVIRREQPDGVFLDLHMKDLDGYRVLAQLKADPAVSRLPVVVLTSALLTSLDHDRLTRARAILHKSDLTGDRLGRALHGGAARAAVPETSAPSRRPPGPPAQPEEHP
ncbi:ATP-binding protein [Kitasatospora sp. NPDC059146]|uniref:ATP-binding response regulator n=1 Tax=unclassified Kitasatospora TaxID=2633591 RepID=UPI00369E7E5B